MDYSLFKGRIYVICVGNDLNGDDGAGLAVYEGIKDLGGMRCVFAYTAPENFTDDIMDYMPERVIIIDAADFGAEAGTIRPIPLDSIEKSHFSTHRAPFKMIAMALSKASLQLSILGIQAKRTGLGDKMSESVRLSCMKLVRKIRDARS